MKKLMFGFACAAAMVLCADIESSNTVGYIQKSSPQGEFMIGTVPFQSCAGDLQINKLLTGFTPVAIDWELDEYMEFQDRAAQLQIWNGSDYDLAYYVSNAWYDNDTEDGDYKEGWADSDGLLLEDYEFMPGGAYWLKNVPDAKDLNIAGEVKTDAAVEFACPLNAFMLSGNAFPASITLNGTQMTSDDITPVAINWELDEYMEFQNRATQMQVWNGSDYDLAYYVSNAWYDNDTEDGDYKEGWADSDGLLLEDYEIPAGNGFWIKATSGACTLEYKNPVSK